MHLLGGAEDRVYRAGLDAERATDTKILVDDGNLFWLLLAALGIQWLGLPVEQVCKQSDSRLSPRRAAVDISFAGDDRFRVGSAARESALSALGLGQQRVDPFDDRVAVGPETNRREAEEYAEQRGQ
jgi:hypothetical protein